MVTPKKPKHPCDKCTLNHPDRPKVPPWIPSLAKVHPPFAVVGLAPGGIEEQELVTFWGPAGQCLRTELKRAFAMPIDQVCIMANLTRCRPPGDDFESKVWDKAVSCCSAFLNTDIAGDFPLLLLGSEPLQKLFKDKSHRVTRMRGLWHRLPNRRDVFSTWHPSFVIRSGEDSVPAKQFRRDILRFSDRIMKREKLPDIKVEIFRTPGEAAPFLSHLERHSKGWVFDIETYDAIEYPSRKMVAVDPCHPDFRVRGVAIAWKPDRGAWIELMPWEHQKAEAARLLAPVFGNGVPKGAFNGSFDEEGLVYPGWVPRIANRQGDGMLSLLAINAGGLPNFSLDRAIVDVLDEPQYWSPEKGTMAKLEIEQVAEYAVRDACSTLKVISLAESRLRQSDYVVSGFEDHSQDDEEEEVDW